MLSKKVKFGILILLGLSVVINVGWLSSFLANHYEMKLMEARQTGIQLALQSIKTAIDKDGKVSFTVQGKDGQPEQLVLEKKK